MNDMINKSEYTAIQAQAMVEALLSTLNMDGKAKERLNGVAGEMSSVYMELGASHPKAAADSMLGKVAVITDALREGGLIDARVEERLSEVHAMLMGVRKDSE